MADPLPQLGDRRLRNLPAGVPLDERLQAVLDELEAECDVHGHQLVTLRNPDGDPVAARCMHCTWVWDLVR